MPGQESLRGLLLDVFAEVAGSSAIEANRLMEKYPDFRHAIDDLGHAFWSGVKVRCMLNEAQATEFRLRIQIEKSELDQDMQCCA